jgi:hypothetical protein
MSIRLLRATLIGPWTSLYLSICTTKTSHTIIVKGIMSWLRAGEEPGILFMVLMDCSPLSATIRLTDSKILLEM